MIRRLLVVGIVLMTVACASPAPKSAAAFGDPRDKDPKFRYGPNVGPSPVGAIPDVLMNDAQRGRDVKLSIDYPTRPGPHPLIILSHGGGGSNRGYPGLSSHWASYGYVVIRPAHTDTATIDEMTVPLWRDRVRDVTFILDSLTTLAQRYPELEGKIDATKVVVAGHARGAVTAMMLGGLKSFPGSVSYTDPRVKAIVAMSPVGPQQTWGFTSESWTDLRVPTLYITGSNDKGASETETPEWREEAFALSPAGDKWLVTIEGVRGQTFTGLASPIDDRAVSLPPVTMNPNVDPRVAAQQQTMSRARQSGIGERTLFGNIRSIALAFFDAYLKNEAGGRDYLTSTDQRPHIVVKTK